MDKKDIDKLLRIREAWDKRKSLGSIKGKKQVDAVTEMYGVLWEYGMETGEDIAKFNDEMCLQFLSEYRTIMGKCDFCEGYDGEPPCLKHFKGKSCMATKKPTMDKADMYRSMLDSIRAIAKALNMKTTKQGEVEASVDKPVWDRPVLDKPLGDESYDLSRLKAAIESAEKTGRYYAFCPEGHGFYNKYEQIKLGDILDILWEP